ncbi:hypothetical protein LWI28_009551 [Acer negundo]|uniref:Uncharacterized protein n=1 Tax=Acer negundo TaxID=4023 RepID=A0AAD5IIW6_ACENE|nr:hypothetical protein LWI28_009551 [Acer negundo]
MAVQVIRWKHDLEKEVIRSTCRAYERNELRNQLEEWKRILVTVEEMEAKDAALDPNPVPVNDTASSNRLSYGDAGALRSRRIGRTKSERA